MLRFLNRGGTTGPAPIILNLFMYSHIVYLLIHLLSAKIYFQRLVEAEALMLRCKQVLVKHQEVRILAGFDGTL